MEEGSGNSEVTSVRKTRKTSRAQKTSKKKENALPKIAEALSVIAETCRSRNHAITSPSIGEVMVDIQNMDEVTNDLDFFAKCCQCMMFKPAREMFIALRGSEDMRLNWLKYAANNPLPFRICNY